MKGNQLVWAAYLAVCICWGSTYLAVRIGVHEMPPILFTGVRFVIAGIIILGFAIARELPFPKRSRDYWDSSVIGWLLLFASNGLMASAQQWVQSGIAALIIATVPLFTALIEYYCISRKLMTLQGWMGLLVGFAGVGVLIMGDHIQNPAGSMGVAFLFLASLCWAIGSVYSKKLKPTGSAVTHIGIQMISGGTALILTGLLLGEGSRFQITGTGIWAMLYLILFGSIIGYSSYIYVLEKWTAAKAGTYAYINPMIAVVLGAMILDEKLNLSMIVAMIVILAGVMMVQLSKDRAMEG